MPSGLWAGKSPSLLLAVAACAAVRPWATPGGVWLDFERGYAWALLTNRVHPSRHQETGIQELRRTVGNAIAAAWKG